MFKTAITILASTITNANTNEENASLYSAYKRGDKTAYDKLVTGNLRLVSKVASRYATLGFEYEELFSQGVTYLMQAIEKYDSEKCRLSNWIYFKVDCLMKDYTDKLRPLHGRYRTMSEEDKIVHCVGLDDTINDESDLKVSDTIADERPNPQEVAEKNDALKAMKIAINAILTQRERQVIELRYFQGMKLREVAELIGVYLQNVSYIEKTALAKVRKYMEG